MKESFTSGSVRGAAGNGGPYRDHHAGGERASTGAILSLRRR